MMTGAAYIRVSTEDQLEYSPDSQIRKIREYAGGRQILLPEEYIYVDEGISGRTASKRPEFMRMIRTAREMPKPFEVILVWKFSRFARSRQDSILYKSMLRKEYGIDVVSVTEQLTEDPTSILIEALLEAMDEYYSINLGQEVKRGMNEKFLRGGVVSVPPFGYRMGEERFIPEETEACFVREIYRKYLDGESFGQIAGWLNESGVRTVRGNRFEGRTVRYILTNPVYTGRFRRQTGRCDKRDRFLTGSQVQTVPADHCPLISPEVFEAVQARIGSRKEGTDGKTSHRDLRTD